MERPGRFKIGYSRNALERAGRIATEAGFTDVDVSMAMPVAASMAKEIEKEAHRYLWSHRSHGEWFKVSDDEAVDAVERALLEMTRRDEACGSARPNAAIDLSTPEGQAVFEQCLRRTRRAP